jgi:16S rRNA (adenine1518-N6/adenine1519-N6)-dimethyltransferase
LARVGPGDLVVEIGPGLGSLTLALVETGADVIAIEVDRGLAAVTAEVVGETARVVEADAMDVDWDELIGSHSGAVHVVANLPYNIGTTLILDILAEVPAVQTLTVLVQTEVAERLAAPPGSKIYGIPSVLTALYASAEVVATVPATVFVPRPKVQSSVVRIVRRPEPPAIAHSLISTVLRAGFGQRRKMLRQSMKSLLTEPEIVAAGIDPTARPEQLDLAAWVRLANAIQS